MKKLIAILALSLSLLLCLTACGSKMPYDLSGTVSVELHAYNLDPVSHFLGFCFLETAQGYAALDKLPTFLGHIGIILFGFTYGVIIGMNTISPVHSSTSSRIAPSVTSCFKRLYSK